MTSTIIDSALAREHKNLDLALIFVDRSSAAPEAVSNLLRVQARIDLLEELQREVRASAKADYYAILPPRVEEEPIAPPHPGGERGAAFSKALRRGITPRGPHTGVQHTGLPEAGGRPPGDYCAACASRWCVCPDRQR